jgi:hypothetical protein
MIFQNLKKNQKSKILLAPRISDKGYLTYTAMDRKCPLTPNSHVKILTPNVTVLGRGLLRDN